FKKFSKEYMNIFNSFQQLLKQDITNALRKDPLRILDNVLVASNARTLRERIERILDENFYTIEEKSYLDILNQSLEWLFLFFSLEVYRDIINNAKNTINTLINRMIQEPIAEIILNRISTAFKLYDEILRAVDFTEKRKKFFTLLRVIGGFGKLDEDPGLLIFSTATLYKFILKYFYPLTEELLLEIMFRARNENFADFPMEIYKEYRELDKWFIELDLHEKYSTIIRKIKEIVSIRFLVYLLLIMHYRSNATCIEFAHEIVEKMLENVNSKKLKDIFRSLIFGQDMRISKKMINNLKDLEILPLPDKSVIKSLVLLVCSSKSYRNR
ncbi:MAG: hypothetical protein ACTSVW_05800, partial [Candidatus Njordarchaeales archaeon]